MKKLSDAALSALSAVEVDGCKVRLTGQLDRKLYLEVNQALESLGGSWDRKAKGHVFSDDPTSKIDSVVYTGAFSSPKSDFDFFETPPDVADMLVEEADIDSVDGPGPRVVLDPSAGTGALGLAVLRRHPRALVHTVEIQPENRVVLTKLGFDVHPEPDFLKVTSLAYPRIIMNPPFSGTKGIDHVERAFSFLLPRGRLVSVMPAGVRYRQDKRWNAFRSLVERCGRIAELPDGSFKPSGTMVRTVMVTMNRGAE